MTVIEQAQFTFVANMDKQARIVRETKRLNSQRANAIAILRSHVQQYPKTEYEKKVVPKGVRLKHFVIGWECNKCPYACTDHSLGYRFGTDDSVADRTHVVQVCVKDMVLRGYVAEREVLNLGASDDKL